MGRTPAPSNHGRRSTSATLAGIVLMSAILGVAACRPGVGVPIIDTAPKPAEPNGTISGTVRGPEGTSAIEGRKVEAINVATGERQSEMTSSTGGFTFKVKPGKYRLEVALENGESFIKRPDIMTIDKSDVDAHADFVLGVAKVSRPQNPAPASHNSGLGSPIA